MNSQQLAVCIRRTALQMVHNANASHIGSCLSITDIVAVLYADFLNVNPLDPKMPERDRFILSKGHAGVAVYAALAHKGFYHVDKLDDYGKDGSSLMAHISHKVPGVEFSTGSLGHGLPFGVGKAKSLRLLQSKARVVVLLSDGELDEGSNWEAMMFAAHHKLSNLIAIVDYNKLQSLTSVEKTLGLEPLRDKFVAFGWRCIEVDGHDHAAILQALSRQSNNDHQPLMVLAHTTKGKGVSYMENQVAWHYKSPNADLLAKALAELEA
jgi:transketolase